MRLPLLRRVDTEVGADEDAAVAHDERVARDARQVAAHAPEVLAGVVRDIDRATPDAVGHPAAEVAGQRDVDGSRVSGVHGHALDVTVRQAFRRRLVPARGRARLGGAALLHVGGDAGVEVGPLTVALADRVAQTAEGDIHPRADNAHCRRDVVDAATTDAGLAIDGARAEVVAARPIARRRTGE